MRIGVDARPLTNQLDGIGVYLKCLLDSLQEIDDKNHYYLISSSRLYYQVNNPKWEKIEGLFKNKLASAAWMHFVSPAAAVKLKLDLFWSPRHHLPLLLPPGIKTVLTIHDVVHRVYPHTMPFSRLVIERLLVPLSLLRANYVITDAESTALDLVKYYRVDRQKMSVIRPGVPPLPRFSGESSTGNAWLPPRYVLFVGTLDPRKNLEQVLKAYELVDPASHGLHLVIVGARGWKNRRFLKMVDAHPLKSFIHLTGYVPRERLATYYENALCLLFPSLYEGFGFPILEAMSCGTPVITSDRSSMPEVSGKAAVFVAPDDVQALAGAIDQIVRNNWFKNALGEKGRERVKSFSWRACALRTLSVFEQGVWC